MNLTPVKSKSTRQLVTAFLLQAVAAYVVLVALLWSADGLSVLNVLIAIPLAPLGVIVHIMFRDIDPDNDPYHD